MAEKKTDSKKISKEGVVRRPDGTIEVTIIIPWTTAKKAQDEIENNLLKQVKIAGFRPGQAPKNVAKAKLNPELVKEEVLKKVVGTSYNEALKKYNPNPIISPHIHIEVFTEGTDIIFTAETCEEPTVELGKYKEAVKNITAKSKIIVPGKEEQKIPLEEILDAAIGTAKIDMPAILIENETSRLLSQMLDELKKLGLTLDQYLSSRNLEAEKIKAEYRDKAEQDLKLEFFLRKVADAEKITVEKEDIEKALNSIENPTEREEIMKNPYLVASIIRQQKTVTFLTQL
ncbi:MAG: trigger factor [Candidatus Levybacteria bacterium]|nr:trigger factor [Candidatus Levybacteria bacterium]